VVAAPKPLLSLTAGDLMTASVVMVPEEMSLPGAAHLLTQARVTGAPVVNHEGRCVGVLSSTDFVHWIDKNRLPGGGLSRHHAAVSFAWEIIDPETLPEEAVHHHMTRDVVFVEASTPIGELARMMIDAHIHRIIVVDPQRRPVGIVSSTDVLAALVRAADSRHKETVMQGKTREPQPC